MNWTSFCSGLTGLSILAVCSTAGGYPRGLAPQAYPPATIAAQIANGRDEPNPFALQPRSDELGARMLAHAILVKSAPEREATVTDVPEEVLLIFNDAVGEQFLALAVIDGSGKRVDNHDAKLDFTDRSHLRATVSKLVPGRYTVRYRVLSADGHVVSGKYFFQVEGK